MAGSRDQGGVIEKGAAKAAKRKETEAPARSRSTSDGRAIAQGPRKTARTGRSSNAALRGSNTRASRTGSMSNKGGKRKRSA